MQNVVIAKPYQFVPPDRRRFWPAMFRPLLRPILGRVWGVTTVEIVGIESLRSALRERASVLLVPNHCRLCDAMVVAVLGAQVGTPLYTMASWHVFMGRRYAAWLLRRLGAFSVYREGLDRTAIRTAIELLVEAHRPLVIFPEGILTRSNDRLGASMRGRPSSPIPRRNNAPSLSRGHARWSSRSRCVTAFWVVSMRAPRLSSIGSKPD